MKYPSNWLVAAALFCVTYLLIILNICYEGDALIMMVLLEICKGLWSRHHVVVIVCCISFVLLCNNKICDFVQLFIVELYI